eukprot:4554717-Pyramimonas_sp.AAC.3
MGDVKINDVAGTLFTNEYCEVKIKGIPLTSTTRQTGSCFDQTIPVDPMRRAGAHARIHESVPLYSAAMVEHHWPSDKPDPTQFMRKGDGARVKAGEFKRPVPKPCPPSAK